MSRADRRAGKSADHEHNYVRTALSTSASKWESKVCTICGAVKPR